jgi:hypothetical protein
MSRPIKQGLDYFPLDVDMDDKVELIEAKHGIAGFGILVKLYQKIYKEGYFLNWNEESLLLFSKRINADRDLVDSVVRDGLGYNVFDEALYSSYKILTSTGIQKRYLNAIDRRKEVTLDKRYINVDINGVNVDINWINTNGSTQSKVKDSKVNYIYNEFYDSEITKSEQDQNYIRVVKMLFGENNLKIPLSVLLKMPTQLSYSQFQKIWFMKEKYKFSITQIFEKMQDWGNPKHRTTIYGTFQTFAKTSCPQIIEWK